MPLLAPPPVALSSHHIRLPFLSFPSSPALPIRRGDLVIRMGGGPRTFPGGVSKWQWKRMQDKKAKQLLKARLARERQLYEMRKRAELRDAVTHLERPWDSVCASTVALAPNLLSVAADDQLKGLADRFHRPGGLDLWNDRDGPQVLSSLDMGRASARFFPLNAVHSVKPYQRLDAGAERAQGVRENDGVKDVYGHDEPKVEFMENDGLWEPVNALDAGDDNNLRGQSWNNHDNIYGSEETQFAGFAQEQHAMVRQTGRRSGVVRREAGNAIAAGSNDSSNWRNNGIFSDSKGAGEGHLAQRMSNSSGSRRNHPTATARWKPSNTEDSNNAIRKEQMGVGSFSDSEVHGRGFQTKWRSRKTKAAMNAAANWKLSYDSHGNVTRKVRMEGEISLISDNGRRRNLKPKWKSPYRVNQSENRSGRPTPKCRPSANYGERPGGNMRGNYGDGGDQFGISGSASDLEEPTWKPIRKNGARINSGRRDYNDAMSRRFSRGGSGATNMDREDGSNNGRSQRMDRNSGRQFNGDGYSLRPTSELHGSVDRNGGRQFRGDGYSLRHTSELHGSMDRNGERQFRGDRYSRPDQS